MVKIKTYVKLLVLQATRVRAEQGGIKKAVKKGDIIQATPQRAKALLTGYSKFFERAEETNIEKELEEAYARIEELESKLKGETGEEQEELTEKEKLVKELKERGMHSANPNWKLETLQKKLKELTE